MIKIEQIKQLREETAVSVQDCKKALIDAGGDLKKAKEILKKWGKDLAAKKASRGTEQGIIASYIHPNKKIGVLLELDCETDFVAKSQDFQNLVHELCLQIAATREENPLLEQFWIKDQTKTIKDLINDYISKTGENIVAKRFTRYEI
ncbi:MAG: translation elongation factor Ts [Candidatus Nealsonbacteria bacterium]|nr:translation elongation factor Ts [Candidatus Nealsonbacteria bacterium]